MIHAKRFLCKNNKVFLADCISTPSYGIGLVSVKPSKKKASTTTEDVKYEEKVV